MVGYYEIPLYSDANYNNFVRTLYIMIIGDNSIPTVSSSEVLQVTTGGLNVRRSGMRRSSENEIFYQVGGIIGGTGSVERDKRNQDEISAFCGAQTSLVAAQIYSPLASYTYFTDDMNLLHYRAGTYYIKGNRRLVVRESTYSGVKTKDFIFYKGSSIIGTIENVFIEALSTASPIGFYYVPESEQLSAHGSVSNKFAAYLSFCMYESRNGQILNNYDGSFVGKTTIAVYGTDDGVSSLRYKSLSNTTKNISGLWYKWFGEEGNIEDIVPDVIKHKTNPPDDFNNTYPGGGQDKNPYPPDGESGKGTFDNTNDPIDFPSMPTLDATSTGFISMWNPTISEISQLYSFLWDSDISTTLKKLFIEPMDAIISLAFFPVDPINFSEKRNVTIGHVDTEITMYPVQKQFVDFDFGTIKLDEYYGAAWDYSPYTKVSIYLPYIGSQELDVDDVMNADLHLRYRIDLLSGMCTAMLKCTRDRDDLNAVVYTWQGNCAMQVPVTAGSAREFINSIIQIGAMTGLALVQPAAGALAMGTGDLSMSADIMAMKNNFVNPTMATYAALNVLGQKVHVQRGGRVDANAGVMSPQSAYLIIDRPISAIPKGWNEYAGYPSLKIKTLSSQTGMTQVAYIKLNGLEATAEEISELDSILKAGVIL